MFGEDTSGESLRESKTVDPQDAAGAGEEEGSLSRHERKKRSWTAETNNDRL
jgi:hypothetical protein